MIPQLDFIFNFAVKQSLTHGCAKNVSMISPAFQASTEAKLIFDMNSLPHKNGKTNISCLTYVHFLYLIWIWLFCYCRMRMLFKLWQVKKNKKLCFWEQWGYSNNIVFSVQTLEKPFSKFKQFYISDFSLFCKYMLNFPNSFHWRYS